MKSMREVNLETYSLSLLTAKEDILNPRSKTNWALYAYDGIMNRLKLADSGGGLKELSSKLHPRRPLYGMCRVGTAQPCIVMILWVGNEVDEYRRAECMSHVPAIRAFFKEVHIFLPAHTLDEITEERICKLACNAAVVTKGPRGGPGRRMEDKQAIVGTNYKRTIAAAEIQRIQRDSFWAQAEREEEERKKEEQRRAAEDKRQREKERMLQEKRDAMERERRLNEKEQKIKEQRRIQAQMEAEAHKQEKLKWEQQGREREEEEMRARCFRSESEEKSAEAAALVSQRVANPREFFRQLSSTSLHTASSPSSLYPVKSPHKRLQTDSTFSYNESLSSTPASPYKSPLVSPYFQSTSLSQNSTLFNNSAASSLQSGATGSIKSQIHLSSSKIMEPFAVTAAGPVPGLRTQQPSTDATESEIKNPIGDILDSLVFYPPPPPTTEQLKTDESEMVDEFPPPPPGFENTLEGAETLVDPSDSLMSSLPPSRHLVPEPPARPLPALPDAPLILKDVEPERGFIVQASVISIVEEEENEEGEIKDEGKDVPGRDGERRVQEEGKGYQKEEEHDGMNMEKHESVKESNGKMLEEGESGIEQDRKMLEERESGKEQDGKILEEHESAKKQDEKMLEEHVSGKEQDGKMLEKHESGKEQDGKMVEKHESGKEQDEKMLEEHENGKEQDEKMLEEHESGKEQDGKMLEKHESGKEQDGKMLEKHESGKEQDGKMLEEHVSVKEQDGKMLEEHVSGKEQDGKMLEEHESGKEQDGKMLEEHESGKEQDGKMLEEHECGKKQDGKMLEEHECGKEQDGKMLEEHVSGKEQDGKMLEEHESGKEQDGKMLEEHESGKELDGKMLDERESGNEQDGKMLDERESGNEQDGVSVEEEESEETQLAKIMVECALEKEQDMENTEKHEEDGESLKECEKEKIIEEHEQAGKIVDVFGNENEQYGKNMEVFKTEKSGEVMEECGQENEQYAKQLDVRKCKEEYKIEQFEDWKIIEECDSKKILNAKIMFEHMIGKVQDGIIVEAFESNKEQDRKRMEVFETEQIQYVKRMEECRQENEQDRNVLEKCENEHVSEKEQGGEIDGKIVEQHGSEAKQEMKSEKEQYGTSMEVVETEKCGQENAQDGKSLETFEKEHDNEKEQDGKIIVKYEDGKSPEDHESEKKQDWKIRDDCESEKIQDGDIAEEHESGNEDKKVVKVFETETIQYEKIMEECGQENEQNGKEIEKCMEDHKSEKVQDMKIIHSRDDEEQDKGLEEDGWEIMEKLESEKTQNERIMLEYVRNKERDCKIGERHADRKSVEELKSEKDQDWKMTEDCESKEIQHGNIMEEHESKKGQDEMMEKQQIQDNDGMSRVDGDRTVNATVLKKEESYTEIIKRDETTAEGVEHVKSEKKEMNRPLIQTEESSAVESDLSNLSIQRDSDDKKEKMAESVDSQTSSKNSPDVTETHVIVKDEMTDGEMLKVVKIVDGCNDLAEGINVECKTSPISENQAKIGLLDEGEELVPVSHFLQVSDTAMDLKHCITHQLDPTNDIRDVEEGDEVISLVVRDTDVKQNFKCDSVPDQKNEDIKHTFLQKYKTITETPRDTWNDKTANDK